MFPAPAPPVSVPLFPADKTLALTDPEVMLKVPLLMIAGAVRLPPATVIVPSSMLALFENVRLCDGEMVTDDPSPTPICPTTVPLPSSICPGTSAKLVPLKSNPLLTAATSKIVPAASEMIGLEENEPSVASFNTPPLTIVAPI